MIEHVYLLAVVSYTWHKTHPASRQSEGLCHRMSQNVKQNVRGTKRLLVV